MRWIVLLALVGACAHSVTSYDGVGHEPFVEQRVTRQHIPGGTMHWREVDVRNPLYAPVTVEVGCGRQIFDLVIPAHSSKHLEMDEARDCHVTRWELEVRP